MFGVPFCAHYVKWGQLSSCQINVLMEFIFFSKNKVFLGKLQILLHNLTFFYATMRRIATQNAIWPPDFCHVDNQSRSPTVDVITCEVVAPVSLPFMSAICSLYVRYLFSQTLNIYWTCTEHLLNMNGSYPRGIIAVCELKARLRGSVGTHYAIMAGYLKLKAGEVLAKNALNAFYLSSSVFSLPILLLRNRALLP